MTRRPGYFYGGPPKAGSSWIHGLLAAHPEVFVPEGKYVQYFTDFYDRGMAWYEGHFSLAGSQHKVLCDLTTDYLFEPKAAERLAQDIPTARIFFSLRNPIDRDWSAYQHLLRLGQAYGPIEEEIETANSLLSQCSAYSDAIERSWRLFGQENTFILWFDDIRDHPQEAARALYEFLGVSQQMLPKSIGTARNVARLARCPGLNGVLKQGAIIARNAGFNGLIGKIKQNEAVNRALFTSRNVPKLRDCPDQWRFLSRRHASEIDRLEVLLSRDLSSWRSIS